MDSNMKISALLQYSMRVIVLCTGLIFSPLSSANSSHPTQQSQLIFTQLASQTMVRAEFIQQKQLPSVAKTFNSTGHVTFSKVNGVLWQIQTPVQADLVMTPKMLVQKTARTESKIALDKSPYGVVAQLFLQLMTGDQHALAQNFNIQSVNIDQRTRPVSWKIHLTPKSGMLKKLFNAVEASGDQYVQKMVITEKNQGTTTIHFKQQTNVPLQLSNTEHALFQLAK